MTWLRNSCVALGYVGGGASSHAVLVVDCSGSMRKEAGPVLSVSYSWHFKFKPCPRNYLSHPA